MPLIFMEAPHFVLSCHANTLKTGPKIAQIHQRQHVVTADTILTHKQLLTVGRAGLFVVFDICLHLALFGYVIDVDLDLWPSRWLSVTDIIANKHKSPCLPKKQKCGGGVLCSPVLTDPTLYVDIRSGLRFHSLHGDS